jgi:hypothetical protein
MTLTAYTLASYLDSEADALRHDIAAAADVPLADVNLR